MRDCKFYDIGLGLGLGKVENNVQYIYSCWEFIDNKSNGAFTKSCMIQSCVYMSSQ